MRVSIESTDGLKRQLKIGIPKETVDQEINNKLNSLTKTTRINGFRPGKIPLKVIKQKYGLQVRQEIVGELLNQSYHEALEQEKIRPATEPTIELLHNEEDRDVEYTVAFEIFPEMETIQLAGMQIDKPVAEVCEADVEQMITTLRKQNATWHPSSEPAAQDDMVTIDFKGTIDGESFEGGNAENQRIALGGKRFIDGFEEGLYGHSAGDTVELDLQFPENYHNVSLSGKPVHFTVSLHKVEKAQLPEIDEQFIQAFNVEPPTIENFRTETQENMQRQLKQSLRDRLINNVFKALIANNAFSLPETLVNKESENKVKNTLENFKKQGLKIDQLHLSADMFKAQTEYELRQQILLSEIISRNKLRPDAEKVQALVQESAITYEDPQAFVQHVYSDPKQLKNVENIVLLDQAIDWLLSQKEVEIREIPTDFFSIMDQRALRS